MERHEVVDFILTEAKRLNEEEHVLELCEDGEYEKLKAVGIKMNREVADFLLDNNVNLQVEEIPEGSYLAIAMWTNAMCMIGVIDDEREFVMKLASEAGKLGKSIAGYVFSENSEIWDIAAKDFFDDSYAEYYEE